MVTVSPTATRPAKATNLRVYLLDGTTKVVPAFDGLVFDGGLTITQSTDKAPQGSGWHKLASSGLSGWYAPTAALTLAPDLILLTQEDVDSAKAAGYAEGKTDGLAAGIASVKNSLRTFLGL